MAKERFEHSFGQTIKTQREEFGISQAQLASQAGLSQGYLSQIENEEIQNPSAAVLLRIASSLSVDPKVILEAVRVDSSLGSPDEMLSFRTDPELVVLIGEQTPEVQKTLAYFLASLMGNSLPTSMETSPSTKPNADQPVKRQRKQKLGDKIRSLREEVNLSQGGLAQKTGISQGYLSQLENGDVKNPSARILLRVAKALKVDSDELFEAAGYPTARQQEKRYQTEEARIPPELVELLSELSRKQQRRLLLLLREMVSLIGSEETEASPALAR